MNGVAALLFLFAQAAQPAPRRDEFLRLDVTVTSVAGDSVYLDSGRESGIAPGDKVRVSTLEGAPRFGKVTTVSRTSARAVLAQGTEGLDVGARGVVFVPKERLATPPSPAPTPEASLPPKGEPLSQPQPRALEHPPWTAPPEEWSAITPLLAPAHGVPPEERPRRWSGFLASSADWTRDSAGAEEREFLATSIEFDGRVENPFGHGGELGLDVEGFTRRSDVAGTSEHDSRLRVDRLSYAFGGVRGDRDRGELWRFLQREFPEFGFLDGIEYVRRTHALSLGASVGFLPEPDDVFRTGNDFEAALFGRYESDEARSLVLGAGFQKTWHEGAADRDLFAAQFELHHSASTSITSSALVDLYTSGDELKGAGPELTQLFCNASHRTAAGHGVGLFLSRFRFPELERNEFDDVAAEVIANAVNDRVGLDGWLALGAHAQLYGRAERWSDQDDSGGSARARVTWRDALGVGSPFLLELYSSAGKFSDSTGLRVSLRKRLDSGSLALSWDCTRFEQDDVDEALLQHALRAEADFALGTRWSLATYA